MKALLVIDAQNVIVNFKDFSKELALIESVIHDFKQNNDPVIFIKQIDEKEDHPFYRKSKGAELHQSLEKHVDSVIEKSTPSSFFNTTLQSFLEEKEIKHVFITGFNTEFCCMFTAIAAYDRGYQVTFIEPATGTVNDAEVYEMEGLDVRDFVGTVLHWSNAIEVLDEVEYAEKYKND
ncbi:MAG TPA: isochorismatase family protein [Cerasibacillus sp.]|uniref:isochorismatase family protein n=1 Tax=Cerasibacillus sp. TaxID=2498711 RepID=UPI002F3EFA50